MEAETLTEMVRGREKVEVVVLPLRFEQSHNGKVWFEQHNSHGWSTTEPAELKPVRKIQTEVGEHCSGCLYYNPGCVRHTPERWNRFLPKSLRNAKGKEIPTRFYPHCKDRKNRIKIP